MRVAEVKQLREGCWEYKVWDQPAGVKSRKLVRAGITGSKAQACTRARAVYPSMGPGV